MLFIDTSETPSAPDWARLRKSTVFDLAFNPEVETLDFIDQQFPSDVLKYYKPSMEQETQLEEGDELFDYMFALMNALPTGSSAVRPVLLVFPKAAEGAAGRSWHGRWIAPCPLQTTTRWRRSSPSASPSPGTSPTARRLSPPARPPSPRTDVPPQLRAGRAARDDPRRRRGLPRQRGISALGSTSLIWRGNCIPPPARWRRRAATRACWKTCSASPLAARSRRRPPPFCGR